MKLIYNADLHNVIELHHLVLNSKTNNNNKAPSSNKEPQTLLAPSCDKIAAANKVENHS